MARHLAGRRPTLTGSGPNAAGRTKCQQENIKHRQDNTNDSQEAQK